MRSTGRKSAHALLRRVRGFSWFRLSSHDLPTWLRLGVRNRAFAPPARTPVQTAGVVLRCWFYVFARTSKPARRRPESPQRQAQSVSDPSDFDSSRPPAFRTICNPKGCLTKLSLHVQSVLTSDYQPCALWKLVRIDRSANGAVGSTRRTSDLDWQLNPIPVRRMLWAAIRSVFIRSSR